MGDPVLREPRDYDEGKAQDWLGYWFDQEFGRTTFDAKFLLDGGRDLQQQIMDVMRLFFEYSWDQELIRSRDVTPTRVAIETLAEEWVWRLYEILLEARMQGNLDGFSVEFDTKAHREPIGRN